MRNKITHALESFFREKFKIEFSICISIETFPSHDFVCEHIEMNIFISFFCCYSRLKFPYLLDDSTCSRYLLDD